jgi:hypothetical protein
VLDLLEHKKRKLSDVWWEMGGGYGLVGFNNKGSVVIESVYWNVMQRKEAIAKNGNVSNIGARLICLSCSD